ncbi:hypothetical protein QBZ16_000773 [Prototheca wickerhamii]|uniref:NADH:flavin oxidoreductase/NADH oxidase N-terminal domain-containing protein n=1 Tax=Prototheca wickerhamii TaxID=3111 RepID=A0AAD9INU5_PROWI|nr:hypothetical protein QBZ16_000773 [Prototheca wickerhamii]
MSTTVTTISKDVRPLFQPFKHGRLDLKLRMVYAPLTRCRAPEHIPLDIHAKYYAQHTTPGGLLISEGTVISPTGHGYPSVPGIYTEAQVEGWKPVVKAVHDQGATFFCQIWHVGAASHRCYQPGHALPVSPSGTTAEGQCIDLDALRAPEPQMRMIDYEPTRALETEEIPALVEDYRRAARNARAAGFDGVEIHSANGYLLNEFLTENTNRRTDAYGGPIENRVRLIVEVVRAVSEEIGADRVGIRFSPFGTFLGVHDSHPYALYTYLLEELNKLPELAYVHLVEPRVQGNLDKEGPIQDSIEPFRKVWKGTLIAAGGFRRDTATHAVASGHADLVALGRLFLSNPDLPKRWALDAPLNKYNRATFYTPGLEGYLDYPYLDEATEKELLSKLDGVRIDA